MDAVSNIASEIVRKVKEVYAQAYCPTDDVKQNVLKNPERVAKFLNWFGLVRDVLKDLNDGEMRATTVYFLNNLSGIGEISDGILVTRDVLTKSVGEFLKNPVSKLRSMSRQAITTCPNILDEVDGLTIISIVIAIVIDFIGAIVDLIFKCITVFVFYAVPLGTLVYESLKFAAGVLIKSLLIPIIGIFAHFVGFIIDWGIDRAENFFDIKKHISNLIGWIFEKSWTLVTDFMFVIKRLSIS